MAATNIVLVHGAWGDGGHWRKVIPLLTAKGYRVTAVQNALNGFDDDVQNTLGTIEDQDGPVLLVGHSYGGAVISAAGNNPKVVGLVYVAAYSPEKGESCAELTGHTGAEAPDGLFQIDSRGRLRLNAGMFHTVFCQDLADDEAQAMNASQNPTSPDCLQAALQETPAWQTKPTWIEISTSDNTIPRDIQEWMASRIDAREILRIDTSHAAMATKPNDVAELIDRAAQAS